LTPDEKYLYIKIDGEYPILPLTKTIMPFFETLFNEKEMKDIHARIKYLVGLKSKHFKPYEDIVRLWYIHSNQRKNYSICMTGQGLQKLMNNILENIIDKEDTKRIMEIKNKTNQFIRKYKCIYLFKNIEMKNNYSSSLSYSSLDEEETEDDFIEHKRRRL
jgi:hypothetical protein